MDKSTIIHQINLQQQKEKEEWNRSNRHQPRGRKKKKIAKTSNHKQPPSFGNKSSSYERPPSFPGCSNISLDAKSFQNSKARRGSSSSHPSQRVELFVKHNGKEQDITDNNIIATATKTDDEDLRIRFSLSSMASSDSRNRRSFLRLLSNMSSGSLMIMEIFEEEASDDFAAYCNVVEKSVLSSRKSDNYDDENPLAAPVSRRNTRNRFCSLLI